MPTYQSQYTGQQIDAAVGAINSVLENNGFVSVDGLETTLGNYLTINNAASTYLTQSNASSTYVPLKTTSDTGVFLRGDNTWSNTLTDSLRVVNDSSNNSDDAMIYLQNKSSSDWALKINCDGYDYGLNIVCASSAAHALTIVGSASATKFVGPLEGTATNANTLGSTFTSRTLAVYPGGTSPSAGWRRVCRISGLRQYSWGFIGVSGSWNNGAPSVAIVQFAVRHTSAVMTVIGSKLGGLISQLRLVANSGNGFFLDAYLNGQANGVGEQIITVFGNCSFYDINETGSIYSGSDTAAASVSL